MAFSLTACDPPTDRLFEPPMVVPLEEGNRLRVTFNEGPDLVRGFSADGQRLLYRSQGLSGFGEEWRILSVPVEGGVVREEAGIYRAALLDSVATLSFDPGGRTLTTWRLARPGVAGCGPPAPAGPTAVTLTVLRLEETDGQAISALPQRAISTRSVVGGGTQNQSLVIYPAELAIRTFGIDPYGPAVSGAATGDGYVSDGQAIWRLKLDDPSTPPESTTIGVFPAVSPSADRLAFSVPTGVVTTTDTTVVFLGLGFCTQETVTVRPMSWQVIVRDLATGAESVVGDGMAPRFHPAGDRLLVQRDDGLHWLSLASGTATFVPGTGGGYSHAVSPDGAWIAFSAQTAAGHDVFLVPSN